MRGGGKKCWGPVQLWTAGGNRWPFVVASMFHVAGNGLGHLRSAELRSCHDPLHKCCGGLVCVEKSGEEQIVKEKKKIGKGGRELECRPAIGGHETVT